ncbi:hypothetical protein H2201_007257 [Coniosporium apollinis]|uniref:Pathogenesis associated protein Cap20 n=2 Tax=Coniosporium TaxID=2810619 RepID=A0ABQ9NMX3_9PEZI|nr:hypothetical protein H2199_001016 [Cladosporium sp. JES 115]KAJ9659666.1 hypothetical protein H2201_007257 [Coniosporium apollinis]
MGDSPMTNGEKPSSQFLSHLTSLPLVSDSIETYKSNPYGQKTLNLAHSTYDRFGAPFVPYLKGPYSWVAPYVQKADSLADSGLTKAEQTFPIVKEDTEKVKGTILDYALFPVHVGMKGKDYIFSTYDDQYKKTGGDGLVTSVKAAISTEMKVAIDAYSFIMSYLGKGKETAQKKAQEKKQG